MTDLTPFLQLGTPGILLAVCLYAAKTLLPLIISAVGHLGRIADAAQKLSLQLAQVDVKIDKIAEELGDVSADVAGLYAERARERPSRKPTRPASATGD